MGPSINWKAQETDKQWICFTSNPPETRVESYYISEPDSGILVCEQWGSLLLLVSEMATGFAASPVAQYSGRWV